MFAAAQGAEDSRRMEAIEREKQMRMLGAFMSAQGLAPGGAPGFPAGFPGFPGMGGGGGAPQLPPSFDFAQSEEFFR